MKILFITHELPPIGGGGGRAAWQIARRLAARGHDVRILTSHFGDLHEYEAVEGVGIHRIAVRRKRADACPPIELLSFMRRSIREARRSTKEFPPDIVCAFFAVPGGPAAWRLRRSKNVPYVLSLRGSDVPRPELARHQRLHLITRPFLKRVCRDAAALVAVSGALRSAALMLDPNLAIEVVPNGVDTEFFAPAKERSGIGETAEIVFVGRLRKFKGVRYALRALPLIEKTLGHPVKMTVVGDGPEREALTALVNDLRGAGMASEVRFAGWLDADDMRAIYRSASLLALPSLVEGHPNVILEAMAAGVPCVASDVPGIREVFSGKNREGILVPPENEQALADAVAAILGDESQWRNMGRAGIERAKEFSWEAVAESYEAILSRAAGRKDASSCAT